MSRYGRSCRDLYLKGGSEHLPSEEEAPLLSGFMASSPGLLLGDNVL